MTLTLKNQEILFDHPDSNCFFQPSAAKPFVATPAALEMYGNSIGVGLRFLQQFATEQNGLDRLQVFTDPRKPEALWFIEDGDGGAITALLPSDY